MKHTERCNITCPKTQGATYDLVGQSYFTCDNANWIRADDGGYGFECIPSKCMEPPQVMYGLEHTNCTGLAHGEKCVPRCKPGYVLEGDIVCQAGAWTVPGMCIQKAAVYGNLKTVKSRAVQVDIAMDWSGAAGADDTPMDYAWAQENTEFVTTAIS